MASARVLLVDDELDFIQALSERLKIRDIYVDTAISGQKALIKVSARKYDVIILDLAMPGMDGIETLKSLKEGDPDLQVILLTGRGSVQQGVEAIKLGAMDFLEKPADINVLMEKIKRAKEKGDLVTEHKTELIISDIIRTKGW